MPEGWAVARMGTYITFTGGAQPPKETFEYSPNEDNIRLIQIRDYKTDAYATYIPKKLARRFCTKTDVMIGRYGPPLFQILRGIEGAYNVAIMKAEAVPEIMQNDYLYYMLQDGTLLHFLESLSDRTCGQDGVNMFELNNYLILIPPYDEQRRIIKKLEETFPIIESLKENISDLTAAIKQAKSKILDLAIHGKLVPQDPNDEPAEELLKRIATSDNRPYKKFDDEVPFDIPKSWSWCTLGEIYTHTTGKALKKTNNKGTLRKYITTSNLYWNSFDFTEVREMYFTDDELDKCTIKKGDLVLCNGGDVGRAAIWNYDYDICYQNHVSRLRPKNENINNSFFLYLIMIYKQQGMLNGKGVGITSLSASDLLSAVVPLPPYSEQNRISEEIECLYEQLNIINNQL